MHGESSGEGCEGSETTAILILFFHEELCPRDPGKPMFNPEKMSIELAGTLKLCDDWKYIPGKDDTGVSGKEIRKMKAFFRKYKVLFCAVWCGAIQETPVTDYFRALKSFADLRMDFDFYETYKKDMDEIDTVEELEEFVREKSLFNMY